MLYFILKVEESETDVSEGVEEEAAEETDNETETEQVSHGNLFSYSKYSLLDCKLRILLLYLILKSVLHCDLTRQLEGYCKLWISSIIFV